MGTKIRESLDPHQRIRDVEQQLVDRDEEIDRLQSKILEQQNSLSHRWQCIQRLQRERDELRKHNSQLSAKLAEVTRRNSISHSNTPR